MSATKISIPGELVVAATADTAGETIARSGVRLASASGPIFISGTGDPNGVQSATAGSVFVRTDVAEVWQNTDGATAWAKLGSGGATFSGVRSYSSAGNIPVEANTWVRLDYNVDAYDTGGYRDPSYPSRFIAPATGYYHITAGAIFGGFYNRILSLNTAPVGSPTTSPTSDILRQVQYVGNGVTSGSHNDFSTEVTVRLLQDQYVEVWGKTSLYIATTFVDVPYYTPFTMERVG